MDDKSCFFIGHREASDDLLPVLTETVDYHIKEHGVNVFIVGGYGGFDLLVSKVLVTAKKAHPEIRLLQLIPYHPAEHSIEIPKGFDSTYYPPGMEKVPRKFAIVRANRYVVDQVDYLIAYVWHPASNALELLEYANRRAGKGLIFVTNLGEKH